MSERERERRGGQKGGTKVVEGLTKHNTLMSRMIM
jgi:hypothetical protein